MATGVAENGVESSEVRQNGGEAPEWDSIEQQDVPNRQETAGRRRRIRWSYERNMELMECYFKSRPMDDDGRPVRGYRKRMVELWRMRGYEESEQRICDQVRTIKKNGWLSDVEVEKIKRRVLSGECNEEDESSEHVSNDGRCDTGVQDEVLNEIERVQDGMCNTTINHGVSVAEVVPEELEALCHEILEIVKEDSRSFRFDFKIVDRRRLDKCVQAVNAALQYVTSESIADTNALLRAGSIVVARQLGLRNLAEANDVHRKSTVPWWKRRMEKDVKVLRRNISILDQKIKGKLQRDWKYKELERKYWIRQKGIRVVYEELKQRLVAKKTKIRRYEQRYEQYVQNRMFRTDQKRFYQRLNGGDKRETVVPNSDDSVKFWRGIWSRGVEHNREATWIGEVKEQFSQFKQENVMIDVDTLTKKSKKLPNWKTPGLDGVQGYWFKHLSACHKRLASQFNELLRGEKEIPPWITFGKTILCQKDPKKGSAAGNFRPISCLPVMWKLLTGVLAECLYDFLESNELLPEEQKGCKRGSKGSKDQLLIDKMVLRDCKRRRTNLSMAWIDYKKAYDMVPHSWILECLPDGWMCR